MQEHRYNPTEQQQAENIRCARIGSWQVELLPSAPYEVSYTPSQSIIGFSFDAQVGTHAFASGRNRTFRAKPNGLACVPAGCDVYSQSETGGEYLRITRLSSHERQWIHERRFSDLIDATAIDAAFTLRRVLLSNTSECLQYCVHSLMVLEACVATELGESRQFCAENSNMNVRRLKQIDEIIEARIDTQLTVSELAFAVKLSPAYFSREFKKAVGQSPHQYIVDRRLQLARKLLLQQYDLSSIAFACGFSSHSHMTEQFGVRLGVTPGHLRRSVGTKFSR